MNTETKDLVLHIRTIHFTLLAVCLGLLVVMTSDPVQALKNAYEEATLVSRFSALLERNWLLNEIAAGAGDVSQQNLGKSQEKSWTFASADRNHGLKVYVAHPWLLSSTEPLPSDSAQSFAASTAPFLRIVDGRSSPIQSLEEFSATWTRLHGLKYVNIPEVIRTTTLIQGHGLEVSRQTLELDYDDSSPPREYARTSGVLLSRADLLELLAAETTDIAKSALPARGSLLSEVVSTIKSSDTECFFWFDIAPRNAAAITELDCIGSDIGLQARLQRAMATNIPDGPFDTSFHDLDDLTKSIRRLPVSNLLEHLQSELRRTGERFSFMGASIPARSTSRWGLVILLSIQAYLLMHLNELKRLSVAANAKPAASWIALYPSMFARSSSVFSILVLPIVSSFGLAYTAVSSHEPAAMLIFTCLGVTTSLLVATLSIKELIFVTGLTVSSAE